MRILIFSLNFSPEPTGIGLYSGEFAEALANRGHHVKVICGNPHYPEWKISPGYSPWKWSRRVEPSGSVIRCPIYIPKRMTGLGRVMHYLSFLLTSFIPGVATSVKFRPDIVITVAPSLIGSIAAFFSAKVATSTSWLHIQDFEVEAAFATGLLGKKSLLQRIAMGFERVFMQRFNCVSSISPEMCKKIIEKGVRANKVCELRNWAASDQIFPQSDSVYRTEWNLQGKFIILYSGSIARKQGIEILASAARLLANRKDIEFVVCGNGPGKKLIEQAAEGLENFQIHDLQPRERMNELLNLASIHVLPQKASAADLVLPSKLGNMLASGKPVLAGVDSNTGVARELQGAGMLFKPECPKDLADKILLLVEDTGVREKMGEAARQLCVRFWARDAVVQKFEQAAFELKKTVQ